MGSLRDSFKPRSQKRTSLPGYQNSPYMYRANRMPADQNDGKRRKAADEKRRSVSIAWHMLPTYFVIAAIGISAAYILSLTTSPRVVIRQQADKTFSPLVREATTYTQEAEKLLQSDILNRSKITIDTTSFNTAFRKKFPEVEAVAVTLPLMGRRPIVELAIAEPAIVHRLPDQSAFVLDRQGKAVRKATDVKGLNSRGLPVVEDSVTKKITEGNNVLTEGDVAFITTFIQQTAARNMKVREVRLPSLASEVHFRFESKTYYVKASLMTDARQSVGTYLALEKKLSSEGQKPAEYIDVRVEEKAFYR